MQRHYGYQHRRNGELQWYSTPHSNGTPRFQRSTWVLGATCADFPIAEIQQLGRYSGCWRFNLDQYKKPRSLWSNVSCQSDEDESLHIAQTRKGSASTGQLLGAAVRYRKSWLAAAEGSIDTQDPGEQGGLCGVLDSERDVHGRGHLEPSAVRWSSQIPAFSSSRSYLPHGRARGEPSCCIWRWSAIFDLEPSSGQPCCRAGRR